MIRQHRARYSMASQTWHGVESLIGHKTFPWESSDKNIWKSVHMCRSYDERSTVQFFTHGRNSSRSTIQLSAHKSNL